ncbi:hypothetical protein D3C78_898280 [compost metagenome]
MLPGASRLRVANDYRLAFFKSSENVRNQAILGPITTTDYVTCTGRSQSGGTLRIEERLSVGGCQQLHAALAVAVRIMPTHRLVFTIAPLPLAVLITLVGGDIDNAAQIRALARSLQHMQATHHVGGIGFHRLAIGQPHQWLSCHVNKQVGVEAGHTAGDGLQIADIANLGLHASLNPGFVE